MIAIDGKTSRRTRGKGKAALHLVSAFAARQRLVLGQAKVIVESLLEFYDRLRAELAGDEGA